MQGWILKYILQEKQKGKALNILILKFRGVLFFAKEEKGWIFLQGGYIKILIVTIRNIGV